MRSAERGSLVVCFFVCPLLFFTNLTRNPYITQIVLLNLGVLAAAAFGLLRRPAPARVLRSALDWPLAAWGGACALSWFVAYVGHAGFYRPPILNEGLRNGVFLAVNAFVVFFVALGCARESADSTPPPLGPWAGFALGWGALWLLFPALRGPGAAALDTWGLFWDPYGAFVWAAGIAAALWLCRKARAVDFLHLALAAGFLASVYGVLQYFNVELIWPNALNPYGGRSVSTFGNPNFMSSYLVLCLPLAVLWFSRSTGSRRLTYAVAALAMEAALLCSLTRSSWLGAVAALAVLCLAPDFRKAVSEEPRAFGLLAAVGLTMAVLWPSSTIKANYEPSVIGRIKEISALAKPEGSYSPFHQRVLIWRCAWLMGHENPLTGKGWGLFELFYPFYQGPTLAVNDFFRIMRTHANNSHNEVLEVFSQTGLLGLGAYAWLWATFFRGAAERFKRGAFGDGLAAACAAAAAGMLVDNMLNVSLHFTVPAFLFWWLVGTCVGLQPIAANAILDGRKDGSRPLAAAGPARQLALTAACAVLAFFGSYYARVWLREADYFAGFKLLRQGQLPAAVRELESSQRWGPPEVNAIYELGNAYARSDRYDLAAGAYRAALDANAGYDEIYFNLGAVESGHLGHVEKAIDFYRMAWWINPLSNDVYNSLAALFLREPNKYAGEAAVLLRYATHFFPDNPQHWNNLGYALTLTKDYDGAQAAYIHALTIDPTLSVAERNLEALVTTMRRPKPPILTRLGQLRELDARVAKRDFSDSTMVLAQRLAKEFPDMAKAQFIWGSLLLARHRPEEALGPLQWVISKEPGHPWAHANLGEAYLMLGRREDAKREFAAALAADPNNQRAAERLRELGR